MRNVSILGRSERESWSYCSRWRYSNWSAGRRMPKHVETPRSKQMKRATVASRGGSYADEEGSWASRGRKLRLTT